MLIFLPTQGSETPQFEAYKNYIKVTKQNTNNLSEVCFRIWQNYLAAIQKKVRFLTSLSLSTSWPTFLFQGIKITFAPYRWINIHCRTETPDLEELYNFMTIPELRRYQLSTIGWTIKCFWQLVGPQVTTKRNRQYEFVNSGLLWLAKDDLD